MPEGIVVVAVVNMTLPVAPCVAANVGTVAVPSCRVAPFSTITVPLPVIFPAAAVTIVGFQKLPLIVALLPLPICSTPPVPKEMLAARVMEEFEFTIQKTSLAPLKLAGWDPPKPETLVLHLVTSVTGVTPLQ